MRSPGRLALIGAWLLLASLSLARAQPARAQDTGEIAGAVTDSTTHKPLPFANVTLVDTKLGANTKTDGTFLVRLVPPGSYKLRATYIGYEPRTVPVTVTAGQQAKVDFHLSKKAAAGQTKKIVVLDTRPLVNVAEISTVRQTKAADITKMTVDNVGNIIERQVGVSGSDDEVHIRGGRSDETLIRVEGVAMKNVVTGSSVGGTLSAKAVQELQVITGGYQAEYGQAISGVVDVELKEAGEERHSNVEYQSGSFATERLFLQTEGVEPVTTHLLPKLGLHVPGKIGLLIGVDVLSTDTYLPSDRMASNFSTDRRTLRSNYENSVLGVHFRYDDFLRLRQKNSLNGYAKLSWRASNRNKINFTMTKFVGIDHGFNRSRVGDESSDASVSSSSYPWPFVHNMDQYPTFSEETNSQVITWKYAISNLAYSSVSVSHFFNDVNESVQGKIWSQYDEWRNPERGQFFVLDDNGDFPSYQDLYADRWSMNSSYTRHWHGHHEFKGGLEANYYSLQMIDINNPREGAGGLGSVRDLYHVYPNDGSGYAQNQFKYEGFVGHVGLRADYQFLGKAADDAVARRANGMTESVAQAYENDTHKLFGRHYKVFWSPRLGINHPITDRDEMHFNFGHFIQWPRLVYYYSKIGSHSSEAFPIVGNLDLNPQRSVQYEFGIKHQFTDNDAVDITFFNKDIYDYPVSTRPVEATAKRLVYINDDFSRGRGLELQLQHRGVKRWSGSASYEYQIATGKPADPNRIKQVDPEALETGDVEPDLTEQFMPWNRPHRLQLSFDYRFDKGDHAVLAGHTLPDRWGVNFFYRLSSGKAYTPADIRGNRIGKRNSKNAPYESLLDAKLNKFWDLRTYRFAITFEARNLLDTQILRTVDPNTGEAPQRGRGTRTFSTTRDPRDLYVVDTALKNPSFYAEPRNLRLGLEVSF